MHLVELNLNNFRNYENLNIKFNPHINIIYGNNAQGKTNLLESIYMLGLAKSHLFNLESSLIKNGKNSLVIKGSVKKDKVKTKYEINYNNIKKVLKIDGKEIKKVNQYIINSLDIIIFYPEDLEIVKGSPNDRRTYLNIELGQLSNNYLNILNEYDKLLKIRNDLLKKNTVDKKYFDIITNYLVEKAYILYKMRAKFVDKLNESCGNIFYSITKLKDFRIKYISNFEFTDYKEGLRDKLVNNFEKEIKIGATLYGPHRDDLEFYLGDENIKMFGSQGQKRMAVLAMKLSEIPIFKQFKNTNPILLLDDVFSELDDVKKNNIIKYLLDGIQVFITTTEKRRINKNKFDSVTIFKIKNGEVIKTEEVEK